MADPHTAEQDIKKPYLIHIQWSKDTMLRKYIGVIAHIGNLNGSARKDHIFLRTTAKELPRPHIGEDGPYPLVPQVHRIFQNEEQLFY